MYPSIGFGGFFYAHSPQEIKDRQGEKAKKGYQNKLAKARASQASSKLYKIQNSDDNYMGVQKHKSRSVLLQKADILFAQFIKNRDTDKDGNIQCPCCDKKFPAKNSETGTNNTDVQNLHFITRKDYNLRFEETNSKAGCKWCNLDMHLNPIGKAYRNYRKRLVDEFGEQFILEMEQSPRNINKLDSQQLKNVIELYSIPQK